ncbi:MAG: imidazole glycerol phosphate synthase subunit HisF [Candidatus Izemoplasmatales bacterium]|nr:imidazole glycerol phosphate synthase subunit HisF [bacterium]MDZ4195743.1 imidazole glycerol phosphate synthase subunit HisF [Candidatus Izemoplasmatales bacterium]
MLTKRIIPCLDVLNGRVVKGKQFANLQDVSDPASMGKFYSQEGADELVFYDITASSEERLISLEFVTQVAKEVHIPFCVGGGVNTIEDFTRILRIGADKISVNSGAVKNPELITQASRKFGSQCVVLSIDALRNEAGSWNVYINGGRVKTNIDAIEWAKRGVLLGAGEIVINSIDADGMKQGYDIELLKAITEAVNVPVIASGGAGTLEHFEEAILKANVDGILAASIFHYKELSIRTLKQYLSQKGIAIRQ